MDITPRSSGQPKNTRYDSACSSNSSFTSEGTHQSKAITDSDGSRRNGQQGVFSQSDCLTGAPSLRGSGTTVTFLRRLSWERTEIPDVDIFDTEDPDVTSVKLQTRDLDTLIRPERGPYRDDRYLSFADVMTSTSNVSASTTCVLKTADKAVTIGRVKASGNLRGRVAVQKKPLTEEERKARFLKSGFREVKKKQYSWGVPKGSPTLRSVVTSPKA